MKNNSSKTSLFGTLRKAFALAFEAHNQQIPSDELVEKAQEAAMTRRKFLSNTGKAALTTGLVGLTTEGVLGRMITTQVKPRIVIVGGGMAGLSALHTLKKAGLTATVYESSGRTSGRIFTVQKAMGEGTWAEFGAEFIDTNHADMWALAKEFNLELIDYAQASETKLEAEAFFFEGKHRTLKEVVAEFSKFAPQMKKDMDSLPESIDHQTKDPVAIKFDNMSISEYLPSIGATGWIKTFIEVAYESEYGLSPALQSSLNLLLLISPDTADGHLALFGDSDERYKTRGGNQSIPDSIAKKYPSDIMLNHTLVSIRSVGTGFMLYFDKVKNPVPTDYVIMTVPFTRLREVDLRISMPQIKWDVINKLGYGTNSKLMIGMQNHFWRQQGFGGLVYADNGIPNGWDNAQLQTADSQAAGLSILFGGKSGVEVGNGSVESQRNIYLPKWEQIYKGATKAHNGKLARMVWPTYPHNKGSYICYTTGQYTTLSGAEVMPVGNMLFAGEHCGGDFAGFMNGAAQSGREAAEVIIKKLK
jgi:monoamine oxidase